ncbi:Aminotransferase-like, plant mobile domain family protein [Prunus dulcis]|uniref:Aminotransferase-like, plant mobile domain family protein n=1 Tax=Prunus dulcis TaxID=3755 RepID=A0A4Y1RDW4_PRUDU|nr:Aminotransferase-like, plant mobile domain family protein [Prunus dulcis]
MEAQKRGSAKGKRKAESTVQQTRVGRDAFFNFMKKERHEMGKVANAKLDHKVRDDNDLGSSGQVNDSVNEMSFITRCSPDRFHRTVEKLSNEKRLAIKLLGSNKCREFGRVMGLKNTGEDVQLDRPVEDEKVKQLVKSFVEMAKRKIETKNWADHGFNFLCEGVRSFKAKKVAYVNGSLLFLQLLYFDSIVHGGVYVDKSLDPIVSWDNNSVWKMIKWVIKQGGFDSPTVRAEVKRSIEGLALGQIIQAEVQRSVLELTDKVMSQVRSFMKDEDQKTKEDGPPKIRDEGVENLAWKEEFTKLARGDQSRIQTRRTAERRPGLHCREPWVDPSNAKGKAVQKTASKIKIGPFKLKPEDLQDSDFDEEVIIEIENEHHVTRDEFMCLRPEMWINDRVLNAQVYYLQEKGSGNWYFHTYMSIFIPILDRIGSHWYLLVVLMGDKKVELWDSLPGAKYNASRYQLAERIMKVLDYIYNDEIVKYFDKGWQFAKFNIVRTDKARRQLNGCDCGIFVMNWLEDIECTSHGSNKFQHASERVRVALSLLKNPKNKRLKEVRESARRVVDEELDKLAEHGPSIPHHPIARKPMTRSQAK